MTQISSNRLEEDQVVPDFTLPSLDGRRISPSNFKQRLNLVIAYFDFDRCSACTNALRTFSNRYREYRDLEAEILVVSPQKLEDLKGRVGVLPLPFPVLSDVEGQMARAYLSGEEKPAAAVFVTDRFGALRMKSLAYSTGELMEQREILDWLNLIEIECPECGH